MRGSAMFPIRRRSFIAGGSAALLLGSGLRALAQSAPAMTPHEKELYDAARKEGELTWYTSHSDDITAQALGRSFEQLYPGLKVNVLRNRASRLSAHHAGDQGQRHSMRRLELDGPWLLRRIESQRCF